MSSTKRSRSAKVKSPGVCEGSVGFQFLTFHRNEFWSPWTRPTKTSETIVDPTGPSRSPLWRTLASLRM